jgi:two-component system, sensor histidine kinase ChiS
MEFNLKNKQSIALIFIISIVLFLIMSPRLLNQISQDQIRNQTFDVGRLSSVISISGDVLFDEQSYHTQLSEFSGKTHSLIGSWTLSGVRRYNHASYGFEIVSSISQQVALKFTPWIDFNVWVNQELVASTNPSLNSIKTYRSGQPAVVVFNLHEGSNEIVIQIKNDLRHLSGISSEVFIGPANLISAYAQQEIIFDLVFFSSFLITGLFLVIQALLLRGNHRVRWLYFLIALTLIVFAFNIVGYKEKIIYYIFPSLDSVSIFRISDIFRSLHFVLTIGLLFILKYKIFHWTSRILLSVFMFGYFWMVLILPMQVVQSISMTYYLMLIIIIIPIIAQILTSRKSFSQNSELLYSEFSLIIMVVLSALYGLGLMLYGIGFWLGLLVSYWVLLLKVMTLISFFVNNQLHALTLSQQSLEAMKTMNLMKASFYEHTSLQLQQPLSHLLQLSEYLLESDSLSHHHQTLLHVHTLAQNMKRHVQDMMDYERAKDNASFISRTPISLDTFITYVFNHHYDVLHEHQIMVDLKISCSSIYGLGDSVYLFNFFHQLIQYSIKHHVEVITVTIEKEATISLELESRSTNHIAYQFENLLHTSAPVNDIAGVSLRLQFKQLDLMNVSYDVRRIEPHRCELTLIFEASDHHDQPSIAKPLSEHSKTLILLSPFSEMAFNLTTVFHAYHIELIHIINPHEIDRVQNRIDGIMIDLEHYHPTETIHEVKTLINSIDIPIYGLTQFIENQDVSSLLELGYVDIMRQPLSINEFIHRFNTYEKLKSTMHELLNQEIRFLQAQIKPHFLFNALSTIIAMCSFNPQEASQLLENLSDYLRYNLEFNRHDHFISCEQELNMIHAYVNIEQARFQDRCQFETHIDPQAYNFPIIPFLIQPLVENAIKHGILSKEEGGKVVLSMHVKDDLLHVSVRDDGVGLSDAFIQSLHDNQPRQGIGLSNVMRQLKLVYQTSLVIVNQNPGASFSFTIERNMNV